MVIKPKLLNLFLKIFKKFSPLEGKNVVKIMHNPQFHDYKQLSQISANGAIVIGTSEF